MIYVFYILAGGWTVTLLLCALWVISVGWEEGLLFGLLGTFVVAPLVALFAAAPWFIWADEQSPNLTTLKKGQWACVASHSETVMMPISTGKTTTLVPQSTIVCDQYSRINQ